MKIFSVIAGSIVGSAIAGFIWWRFLPEPLIPQWLVKVIIPVVQYIAPNEAHGGEELIIFFALWLYVFAACVVVFGIVNIFKGQNERVEL